MSKPTNPKIIFTKTPMQRTIPGYVCLGLGLLGLMFAISTGRAIGPVAMILAMGIMYLSARQNTLEVDGSELYYSPTAFIKFKLQRGDISKIEFGERVILLTLITGSVKRIQRSAFAADDWPRVVEAVKNFE